MRCSTHEGNQLTCTTSQKRFCSYQWRRLPECSSLGNVRDEIAAVEELSPALALKAKLEEPRKGDVVDGLRRCDIFHFAGHGMPDPADPSKNRLLRDWQENPLTVEDFIDLKRHDTPPFLAYLSACSTGAKFRRAFA